MGRVRIMSLEENVANEVKRKGIKIKAMSEAAGIPYSMLQPSLKGRRPLKADEFMMVCDFLGEEPTKFWPGKKGNASA